MAEQADQRIGSRHLDTRVRRAVEHVGNNACDLAQGEHQHGIQRVGSTAVLAQKCHWLVLDRARSRANEEPLEVRGIVEQLQSEAAPAVRYGQNARYPHLPQIQNAARHGGCAEQACGAGELIASQGLVDKIYVHIFSQKPLFIPCLRWRGCRSTPLSVAIVTAVGCIAFDVDQLFGPMEGWQSLWAGPQVGQVRRAREPVSAAPCRMGRIAPLAGLAEQILRRALEFPEPQVGLLDYISVQGAGLDKLLKEGVFYLVQLLVDIAQCSVPRLGRMSGQQ